MSAATATRMISGRLMRYGLGTVAVAVLFWAVAAPSAAAGPAKKKKEEKAANLTAVFEIFADEQASGIASVLTDALAAALSEESTFFVIRQKELAGALGIDPGMAVFNCKEDLLCITQIGSTLSVNWMIIGNLSKIGDSYRFSIKLIEVKSASTKRSVEGTLPKERNLFEQDVKRLAKRLAKVDPTGSITVNANVDGADIGINGELVGRTPAFIDDLKPGTFRMVVEITGYKTWSGDVVIREGEDTMLAVNLLELGGAPPHGAEKPAAFRPAGPEPAWLRPLKKPLTLSLAGVSVASIVAGTAFGISALNASEASSNEKVQIEAMRKWEKAEDRASIANIFFGLAGASLMAAGVLYTMDYLALKTSGPSPAGRGQGFSIVMGPGETGVSVVFSRWQ